MKNDNKKVDVQVNKKNDRVNKYELRSKKKATFDLDPELHRKLKVRSATENRSMLDIVQSALEEYLNK